MYILKAKKNTEQQDHSQEKRERLDQKEKLTVLTGVTVNIDDKEDGSGASGSDFKPEELPDGICISPKKMTKSNPYENDGNTAVREASVSRLDSSTRLVDLDSSSTRLVDLDSSSTRLVGLVLVY